MKYRFIVDPVLCTGCRTCELACAFSHARNLKQGRSRIYPLTHEKDKYVPVVCLQCDDAACVKSCMFDALRRNEETGAIDLDVARHGFQLLADHFHGERLHRLHPHRILRADCSDDSRAE